MQNHGDVFGGRGGAARGFAIARRLWPTRSPPPARPRVRGDAIRSLKLGRAIDRPERLVEALIRARFADALARYPRSAASIS